MEINDQEFLELILAQYAFAEREKINPVVRGYLIARTNKFLEEAHHIGKLLSISKRKI